MNRKQKRHVSFAPLEPGVCEPGKKPCRYRVNEEKSVLGQTIRLTRVAPEEPTLLATAQLSKWSDRDQYCLQQEISKQKKRKQREEEEEEEEERAVEATVREPSKRAKHVHADMPKTPTHTEIIAGSYIGTVASGIPFSNHNMSQRNTYHIAMTKNAQGMPYLNTNERMDTKTYDIFYPEKPLVLTQFDDSFGINDLPPGQNITLGIVALDGENQEDSYIIDQGAIDLGALRSLQRKTMSDDEKRHRGGLIEAFGKQDPSEVLCRKTGSYDDIEADGLIRVGALAPPDTILAEKNLPVETQTTSSSSTSASKLTFFYQDNSLAMKNTEAGIVDRVMLTTNKEGLRKVKFGIRNVCIPGIADKFASRHGQKGTCGAVKPRVDMPFDPLTGRCPTILVNPQAFPGRMTFGELIEMLFGAICLVNAKFGDGTAHGDGYIDSLYKTHKQRMEQSVKHDQIIEDIAEAMQFFGMDKYCNKTLVNGTTGEELECKVFTGPCFYMPLRHLVNNKLRARSRGPRQYRNRQPSEGRTQDGGLKIGRMEGDCFLAAGASEIMRDKMFYSSDPCWMHICEDCGSLAIYSKESNTAYCKSCETSDSVYKLFMPYGCSLLNASLHAIGLDMKFDIYPEDTVLQQKT